MGDRDGREHVEAFTLDPCRLADLSCNTSNTAGVSGSSFKCVRSYPPSRTICLVQGIRLSLADALDKPAGAAFGPELAAAIKLIALGDAVASSTLGLAAPD